MKTEARRSRKASAPHKYIFVIGGVMSGVGKGIATSSIGTILSAKGLAVNLVKVDPYLNVDAGTMNPTEHGEVFVLDSGLETDQDMGNYERFLNRDLTGADYMTSGMVYKAVIDKERALQYGGRFVDADHVREEIVERIERSARLNKSDITVVEIGGTIGDYQNVMFIEAARVLKIRHPRDVTFVLVSYLPVPGSIGEMKSKPTQNASKQLNAHGVQADFIIARGPHPIDQKRKEKIAFTCNIIPSHVISAPDIESVYDVPVNFEKDRLGDLLIQALDMPPRKTSASFGVWKKLAAGIKDGRRRVVKIGVVGKYFNTGDFILSDSYLSVLQAVRYSAYALGVKAEIETVNARDFEAAAPDFSALDAFDGIIVPGGFGSSGIDGKLAVIRHARERGIPYFGLCYGMQLMTVEYARDVLGLAGAHTTEIDPNAPHPVIDVMPDQKEKIARGDMGGTMRLGAYPARLMKGTIAQDAYSCFDGKRLPKPTVSIRERHRHRYEVNPKYVERLERAGLVFSGRSPDGTLMEIAELPRDKHPFFLGTQFHPEFLARPLMPHPLFNAFVEAAKDRELARAKQASK
ncbi:MAG: CTP synthase [Patescibacteria group bacterium]|nr:CTP synthase [Patescibacteria group bacterium]